MSQPCKSSIGVELEFLLCTAEHDQPLIVPGRFKDAPGKPLFLPPGMSKKNTIYVKGVVQARLRQTIAAAIADHRGTRVASSPDEVRDTDAAHLTNYTEWIIDSDASVTPDDDEGDDERDIREYEWFPTEIASPALWATDASWDEIRAVVRAIRDQYWILTPETAGMHYHYGNGKDWIPFFRLRRLAALLIAADPILTQLHPEHRRDSDFCVSNRLYSAVAHGETAAGVRRSLSPGPYRSRVEEEPERPVATTERTTRNGKSSTRSRASGLRFPFKRGELTGYTFNQEMFGETFDWRRTTSGGPVAILLEVQEMLQSTSAPVVAGLMRYENMERPAYNFNYYQVKLYRVQHNTAAVPGARKAAHVPIEKRTVEFRQMASTMDPDEVVAYGKVVVCLCEWAACVDLKELWRVVHDCAMGEEDGTWYDVFDLLVDLDLVEEAKVLLRAVARFRGERMPDGPDDERGVWLRQILN